MQLTHPPKTPPPTLPPWAGPSNASDSQEPLGDLRGAPHIHNFSSCPSLLSVPGSLLPPSDYKLLTLVGGGPSHSPPPSSHSFQSLTSAPVLYDSPFPCSYPTVFNALSVPSSLTQW